MGVFIMLVGVLMLIFLILMSMAMYEMIKEDNEKRIRIAVKKEVSKIIKQINKERMNY